MQGIPLTTSGYSSCPDLPEPCDWDDFSSSECNPQAQYFFCCVYWDMIRVQAEGSYKRHHPEAGTTRLRQLAVRSRPLPKPTAEGRIFSLSPKPGGRIIALLSGQTRPMANKHSNRDFTIVVKWPDNDGGQCRAPGPRGRSPGNCSAI